MGFSNLITIILYLSSLLLFAFYLATPQTHKVMTYFIPDTLLCLMNITMSCILYPRYLPALGRFFNWFVILLINLGFYINILSAINYLVLYLIKTYDLVPSFSYQDNMWVEFNDIMKFKVTATLHALTFKLYADCLRKSIYLA